MSLSIKKNNTPLVHCIGIGGIGISALARWFLAQNWRVSGSDIATSELIKELIKDGCNVKIGHKKATISSRTALVIYNQAIPNNNPELRRARKLKIPVLSYPQAIGSLTRSYRTIAVAGAHGKSTTTALASLILIAGGFDPTVIIGTKLKEFAPPAGGKNFRLGKSHYLVLEADEWRASFLNYSPTFTIITNIDKEHLDFYKNIKNIRAAFLSFLRKTKIGGFLILNRDNIYLRGLKTTISKIARDKELKIVWYSTQQPEAKIIRRIMRIPGNHNVSNALAAYTLGRLLKIPKQKILASLASYRGAWRRMEYRGKFQGALVFDDYAHHPTEIKATLGALKERYPNKNILCIFQPHQAKRLAALFAEFLTAFDDADETLILPSYEVAGRDLHMTKHDSRELVKTIQKKNPKKLIFYLEKPKNLVKAVRSLRSPLSRKVIVMMGAGNIFEHTELLINN